MSQILGQESGRLYGAVEAGGTKFVCAIGDESGRLLVEERFATAHPSATLPRMLAWFQAQVREHGPLSAIGVGSFGPVELSRDSARYGCILQTPKPDWSGTNMLAPLRQAFDCPIGFDTDVNGAALGELRWGGAQDVADLVYVTIGTGIGGGVLVAGKPVHGLLHPEVGHIYPRRHALDESFAGVCPFHGDCLEGLASGPAINARSGASLEHLAADHPQWEIEADYLAQLCAQLTLTVSPRRLLLGGGVMQQTRLLPLIRRRLRHWLGGYVGRAELADAIDAYVAAPRLGAQAGILGALALAIDAGREV